jgi:hypothetical protein
MFFIFIYEILIKRFNFFQDNQELELKTIKYKHKLETIYENNKNLTDSEKKIKKYFDDKYIIEIV